MRTDLSAAIAKVRSVLCFPPVPPGAVDDYNGEPAMNCPNCHSEDVRRSRRSGPREGIALRLKHQAPYRCAHCSTRFIAREDAAAGGPRQLSFADYLGLRGDSRRFFTDQMILGGLTSLLLLLVIGVFFSMALGWINPLTLFARHA
jgi:DNA-directed RNA polymerase subunit RPC12/RpoP